MNVNSYNMTIQDVNLLLDIDFHNQKVIECKIIDSLACSELVPIESGSKTVGKCMGCSGNFQIFLYGSMSRNGLCENKTEMEILETSVVKMEEDLTYLDNKVFLETPNLIEDPVVAMSIQESRPVDELECQYCSKLVKNLQGLTSHQKFCKMNPDRPAKKMTASKCEDVKERVKEIEETGYPKECRYCQKMFKNKAGHIVHEKHCKINHERQTKIKVDVVKLPEHKPGSPINCEKCHTEYPSRNSLQSHRPFCTGENRGKHLSGPNPKCSYCEKPYRNWSLVRRHEQMVHEHKINFTCEICGFGTYSKKTFELHKIKAHYGNPKPFVCDLCTTRNRFSSKQSILYHMRIRHLNEAKYMCDTCSRKFICKSNLEIHIASVHSALRPFPCPDCDKFFKQPADVKLHRYKIHVPKERKPQLVCNNCDFVTHDKHSFARHKLLHLDEAEKPFHCKFCNKGFPSHSNQLRHEKTHLDIRPYICTFCEKAFRTKEDLKIHVRHHTGMSCRFKKLRILKFFIFFKGEKPYECEICGQRYGDRGCYRSHLIGHEKQLGITLDKSVKKFLNKPKLIDNL